MEKPSQPVIFAVIPAFNESGSLPALLRELAAERARLPGLRWVVVDDGSTDGTAALLQSEGVPRLELPFNLGIGGAVQAGFLHAVARGADFVVQVDADGQHRPDQIANLLERQRATDAHVVIGSRFAKGSLEGHKATTPLRWLGGRWLKLCVRALSGLEITDPTSGFRLYTRQAARAVLADYPDDYPEVESIMLLSRLGLRFAEAPVAMRPRVAGTSSIGGVSSAYYMIKVTLALVFARFHSINQPRRSPDASG